MQDEINILNEKIDNLINGNRRLQASYETRIQQLQDKLNETVALLDECQSGNEDALIIQKELDLCRVELIEEQNSKEQLNSTISSTTISSTLQEEETVMGFPACKSINTSITQISSFPKYSRL